MPKMTQHHVKSIQTDRTGRIKIVGAFGHNVHGRILTRKVLSEAKCAMKQVARQAIGPDMPELHVPGHTAGAFAARLLPVPG